MYHISLRDKRMEELIALIKSTKEGLVYKGPLFALMLDIEEQYRNANQIKAMYVDKG